MLAIHSSVPLAPYTTIGLGGPARYFCTCATEDDVREALEFARGHALPIHILGGGSNVVFADAGFPGLVAHISIPGLTLESQDATASPLSALAERGTGGEDALAERGTGGEDQNDALAERGTGGEVLIEAGAGVVWDNVVAQAVAQGLSGIECLSGIPGTVGGAPIQNIGAYGQEIAATLLEVDCLDRTTLERVTFTREQCGFAYRMSRFKASDKGRYVVLAVRLSLPRDTQPTLRYAELIKAVGPAQATPALVRDTVLALRRSKSMVLDPADSNTRSVGSFFMNPVISEAAFAAMGDNAIPTFPAPKGVKIPAAWLIEHAGYKKGHQHGGVGLSTRHTLALVNRGGTTAELLVLAEEIQNAVFERFGVRLEREAVIVPPLPKGEGDRG